MNIFIGLTGIVCGGKHKLMPRVGL
jgi:hypothetical protein